MFIKPSIFAQSKGIDTTNEIGLISGRNEERPGLNAALCITVPLTCKAKYLNRFTATDFKSSINKYFL